MLAQCFLSCQLISYLLPRQSGPRTGTTINVPTEKKIVISRRSFIVIGFFWGGGGGGGGGAIKNQTMDACWCRFCSGGPNVLFA